MLKLVYLRTYFSVEETKTAILPELVELTNDEHSNVRLAGLNTVVSILTMLDDGLLFATSVLTAYYFF